MAIAAMTLIQHLQPAYWPKQKPYHDILRRWPVSLIDNNARWKARRSDHKDPAMILRFAGILYWTYHLHCHLHWDFAILALCPGVFHLSCATFKGRVCIIHLARKSHACAALQRTWLVWLDHKDMNSCLLYWCHYLVGEGWGAKKSVHSTGHFEHQANPNQHRRLVIYQHRRHGHCKSPELEDVHPFLLGMPQKWWYDGMTISYCSKPKGETTLLWTCQSCDLGRWLKHCTKLWQRDDEGDGMSMFDLLFFSNKWVVSSFPNSPAPHFVYIYKW